MFQRERISTIPTSATYPRQKKKKKEKRNADPSSRLYYLYMNARESHNRISRKRYERRYEIEFPLFE